MVTNLASADSDARITLLSSTYLHTSSSLYPYLYRAFHRPVDYPYRKISSRVRSESEKFFIFL